MAMPTEPLPLHGVRVLVTRPPAQAQLWQERLTHAGAESLVIPLMLIEPLHKPAQVQAIKQCVMDFDLYQHAIFVSQNAVQYGMQWLEDFWPQLPIGVNYYAVGSATARQLQKSGVTVVAAGITMDSEELLALPDLQAVADQRVLIFRGVGGRQLLAETLRSRGARVDYCELYQRVFPPGSAQTLATISDWGSPGDVVALHSGETLHNWQQVLDTLQRPEWYRIPIVVPGPRVATDARSRGFTCVLESANASNEAMLAQLIEWRRGTPAP